MFPSLVSYSPRSPHIAFVNGAIPTIHLGSGMADPIDSLENVTERDRWRIFLIFSSMLFLSMKGLRKASCLVRECLIWVEMWEDSRIRW